MSFRAQPAGTQPESAVQIENLASASHQTLVLREQANHCRGYHHAPANDKPGTEEPMADRGQADEPVLRMDQGNAGHQGIVPRQAGSHRLLRRPCCLDCRASRLQQLRFVQPAHDGCRFQLGEGFRVQQRGGLAQDFFQGATAVEQRDERILCQAHAIELASQRVFDAVVGDAASARCEDQVAAQRGSQPQQVMHAKIGRVVHGYHPTSRQIASAGLWNRIQPMAHEGATIRARPLMPGRS